jgi:hypothetical protein
MQFNTWFGAGWHTGWFAGWGSSELVLSLLLTARWFNVSYVITDTPELVLSLLLTARWFNVGYVITDIPGRLRVWRACCFFSKALFLEAG